MTVSLEPTHTCRHDCRMTASVTGAHFENGTLLICAQVIGLIPDVSVRWGDNVELGLGCIDGSIKMTSGSITGPQGLLKLIEL